MNNNEALPHITASSVLCRDTHGDKQFLVVEEMVDEKIVINQPSGHVEVLESPIDAAIRETLEESRWHFKPTAIIGIYFYHSTTANITYQRICFTGELIAEDLTLPLDEGIIQPLWLTRDELAARGDQLRSPLVLACIDDYLSGQRYSLDIIKNLLQRKSP